MSPSGAALQFSLPADRVATSPPEARGVRRDEVGLLVATSDRIEHTVFRRLGAHLQPDDLLVVNTSPTMAASVPATWRGVSVRLHLSTRHDDRRWTVELRKPDHSGPILDAGRHEEVGVPNGRVHLEDPADDGVRLWRAHVEVDGGVRNLMQVHGRAIRYRYVPQEWPLEAYQTVFANRRRWPGSAEMPSASRPFSHRLVNRLARRGVQIAPIELHAGVSSQDSHEPPQPEAYTVPASTAAAVNATKQRGGRVIAVGTTVTRALETVAVGAQVHPGSGWTDLVLGASQRATIVDGLITGWHPPEASHLDLLQAVAGSELVNAAYNAALGADYLWHEFGDSCLLLPSQ